MSQSGSGSKSSLDAIVASLARSTENLSDAELDKYIADLILKEAQGSKDDNKASGAPSASRAASTNKQFLASMIRNVDGHNRHLIKAQLRSARNEQRWKTAEHTKEAEHRILPQQSGRRLRGWSDDEKEGEEQEQPQHRGASSSAKDIEHQSRRASSRGRTRPPSDKRTSSPPPMPSKMDKYFSDSYDPALDVNPDYSTDPKTGLIADGGWDNMLDHVKQRHAVRGTKKPKESSRVRADKVESNRDRHRRRREDDETDEADDERRRRRRRHEHEGDEYEADERRRRRRRRERDEKESGRHKHRQSRGSKGKGEDSPRAERQSRHHRSSDRHRHRKLSSSPPSPPSSRSHRRQSKSPTETAPRVGSSAMDTVYAKRGAVREWDMGKDKGA